MGGPRVRDLRVAVQRVALLALACGPTAFALGLGAPEIGSGIGQPLSLIVPLSGDDAAKLPAECVRVVRPDDVQDGVAGIVAARTSLIQRDGAIAVRVQTPYTINEPAARVVLEVGCETSVRREFLVLLDPVAERLETAVAHAPAPVLEFGAAEVTSALGQPLAMRVALIGSQAAQVPPECVRVVSVNADAAGAPVIATGGASLSRTGPRPLIRVTTIQPIVEPGVRVTLEAGCDNPIRRDFALLLEAPGTAQAAAAPAPAADVGVAPALAANAPARPAREPPAPRPGAATDLARPPAAARPAPPSGPRPPPRPRKIPPADRVAPAAPPRGDRLQLAAPELPAPAPAPAAVPAPAVPEATKPAAPDDAVAKRVQELEADVQKMRAELLAATALNRELLEAQKKEAPEGKRTRELDGARTSERLAWGVAGGALLLVLCGMVFLWRQRRPVTLDSSPWYETAMRGVTEMGRTRTRRDSPEARAAAAEAAAAAAQLPADIAEDYVPSTRSRTLAGTETIQVTELRDAQQLLNELDVIRESRGTTREAAQAVGRTMKLDLDLSSPRNARTEAGEAAAASDGLPFEPAERTYSGRVAPPLHSAATASGSPAVPAMTNRLGPGTVFGDRGMPLTSVGPETRTALHVDVDLDHLTTPGVPAAPVAATSTSQATRPLDFDLQLPAESSLPPAARSMLAAGRLARGQSGDEGGAPARAAVKPAAPAPEAVTPRSSEDNFDLTSPATIFAELSALSSRGAASKAQAAPYPGPADDLDGPATQFGPGSGAASDIEVTWHVSGGSVRPDGSTPEPTTMLDPEEPADGPEGRSTVNPAPTNSTQLGDDKTQLMVDHDLGEGEGEAEDEGGRKTRGPAKPRSR
jgi:hypothetical protein